VSPAANPSQPDFRERLTLALKAWRTTPELAAAIAAEVDAFFAEHPEEIRDAAAELFIASLVFNRVTSREATAA